MDFLDWAGNTISDGIDWLFKDGHWINAATTAAGAFSSSTKDSAAKALLSPPKAAPQSVRSGPGFRSTQVASEKPADVHTLDSPLFKGKQDDPWMYTFRSVVNRNVQAQ